jgi:transcriptional regulator with XRE-family HTH domain
MSNLGIRLKQARKRAGLSRRKLADFVALSNSAIKKYEEGDAYPSSDILLILAKALKVRADFFFRPVKVVLENVRFRVR